MGCMTAPSSTIALEAYRPALLGHCYRMLGSIVDAEDAVQEAMLRAWKHLDGFREQASVKTWLYRIATNVCLDTIGAANRRRLRPIELSDTPAEIRDDMPLLQRPREEWVEPIPDALTLEAGEDSDPERRAIMRESLHLAFVAALQYLPARQRAVLLLTQVLGFSAADAAETLELSVASVNSALQRARATLEARNPAVVPRELTHEQTTLLAKYVDAFERYDVQALTTLLHEEVTMSMPPYELWLLGRDSIATWFLGFGIGCKGSRILPAGTASGGMPAFAQYRQRGAQPWGLHVLELEGATIRRMHTFLDVETLFPRFGVPLRLTA